MGKSEAPIYDPQTFHDALPRFRDGTDTPRKYLERAI